MPSRRRLLVLVAVCALVALPAGVLRATCAAKTCDQDRTVQARVPFCPLPGAVKSMIADGFYEKRSPDVIGVGAVPVTGGAGEPSSPWPSAATAAARVPLAFLGTGIDARATLPERPPLDQV